MKSGLFVAICLLGLTLSAPAVATDVNVKYAEADYSSWETWDFAVREHRPEIEIPERVEMAAKVRVAISARLADQGFRQASEGETPDFRVAIDGAMREVFDVRDIHKDLGDHVAFVMEGGTTTYREGTLMIRVLEGSSGDLVWTGWVVDRLKNPAKPDAQIRKVVKKILRKFPPDSK